jgi:hypothetical protein
MTEGLPTVSVPVLSNMIALICNKIDERKMRD